MIEEYWVNIRKWIGKSFDSLSNWIPSKDWGGNCSEDHEISSSNLDLESFIGKSVRGVRELSINKSSDREMELLVGKKGVIVEYDSEDNSFRVEFPHSTFRWYYVESLLNQLI